MALTVIWAAIFSSLKEQLKTIGVLFVISCCVIVLFLVLYKY